MKTPPPAGGHPRLCAHRGFNAAAPENTLPAFAAAVMSGAGEIELDLWPTADGEIVVCHDPAVDRTTDGKGAIATLRYRQIARLDAGLPFSPVWKGTRIPLFEEVLDRFAGRVVMNIHIKSLGGKKALSEAMLERGKALARIYPTGGTITLTDNMPRHIIPEEKAWEDDTGLPAYDPEIFQRIAGLVYKYGCQNSVYFTGEKDVLITAARLAPDIGRCCLEGHMNYTIVENALRYGCSRVQFCKTCLTREMIAEAHDSGLVCNLFWSDDAEEARRFLGEGIDVLLTNDIGTVKAAAV
ncbi:Glycerophosphoryl diester phosphodiesterase [Sporobacter termitidis DSM 10068]|uniref:Glycerophosphoryl diester phosphodiesterase n=1 Tax=Sporobacter termitidis DSM 10068 TaxID=1123282 RepID=A0A1M5XBX6_9FIRM|nr:glycerophosphodiester phosphodiesterase family protein [Sporobacter termitidis]SHH97239.1 Glycerophosphoryl diester phosphodiesterase [Sporobacter termitidis DSM 10068]